MKARDEADDGFFIVPVAAGQAAYDTAAEIVSAELGLDDFSGWNFDKTDEDRLGAEDAVRLARRILHRRLSTVEASLDPDEPLRIGLWTWGPVPSSLDNALRIDWTRHFDGRFAKRAIDWEEVLLPALKAVAGEIYSQASSRKVVARGNLTLTAALAIGVSFFRPRAIELTWMQNIPSESPQPWTLDAPSETAPVQIRKIEGSASDEDILVVVDLVKSSSERAIKLTQADGHMPTFRGSVIVEGPKLSSPGQAADAVEKTVEAVKKARREWPVNGKLHLVLAAPAGFAVMLGQCLNGLGPVQTYEHSESDIVGRYVPGPVLKAN